MRAGWELGYGQNRVAMEQAWVQAVCIRNPNARRKCAFSVFGLTDNFQTGLCGVSKKKKKEKNPHDLKGE